MPLTRIESDFVDLTGIEGIDFDVQSGVPTLKVEADNHRVGVGNNTPAFKLDVVGDINVSSGSNFLVAGSQISTANVAENSSYLYYTNARARNSISVTDSGGDGSLSYNSGTGVITYTGPNATSIRAHFSGGSGISITSGSIAIVDSVGLSGTPTAPTAAAGTNTTQIATTAFVSTGLANLVDSAPGALDTLNELAAALGDDANFSTTITNSIATKLPLAGGQMTGNITFSGSQTVDGRDLSADGTKLDGIESNATANQTAAEILTAIKTVDGSGSGLDADLLDGVQGSSYLRSDAADTFSGNLTGASGANILLNSNIGDSSTTTFNSMTGRLEFDHDYSDSPRGPNKIVLYDTDNWISGFGIHNSTTAYYSGDTHKWYNSSGATSFTETANLSGTGSLSTTAQGTLWGASNDGAGSGLDADTLDGEHGSYYLNYNNFSNTPTIPTNNNQLTNGAGYVTANTQLSNEQVQDIVGGMVSSNTESGITVTYKDSDGTIDFSVALQTDNNFTTTLKNKLDGIEAGATGDQSAAEIRSLVGSASDSNIFTDADHSKLDGIASGATNVTNNNQLTNGAGYVTSNTQLSNEQVQDIVGGMVSSNTESGITVTYKDSDGTIDFSVSSQTDNNFTTTLKNKLDGIEASATADQTAAEIRTLVDSATDSNVFTDDDHTKLDGIEASATADQTAAEIRTLVGSATDSNVFTDADHTKLDGIEASADVTDATNVNAAGAVMNSDTSTGSMSFVVDEDNMSSN